MQLKFFTFIIGTIFVGLVSGRKDGIFTSLNHKQNLFNTFQYNFFRFSKNKLFDVMQKWKIFENTT